MEDGPSQPQKLEPPDGMYPARMDDRGRVKLPAAFQEYLNSLDDKKLFVTSLDRRIAQIYPIRAWRGANVSVNWHLSGRHSRFRGFAARFRASWK